MASTAGTVKFCFKRLREQGIPVTFLFHRHNNKRQFRHLIATSQIASTEILICCGRCENSFPFIRFVLKFYEMCMFCVNHLKDYSLTQGSRTFVI